MKSSSSDSQLPPSLARYSLTHAQSTPLDSIQLADVDQARPEPAAHQQLPTTSVSTHVSRRTRVNHAEWTRLTRTRSDSELPIVTGASSAGGHSNIYNDEDPGTPLSPHPPYTPPFTFSMPRLTPPCTGDRSIIGLPVMHPQSHPAVLWSSLMLLLDATYTAFVVPAGCAFCNVSESEHIDWCSVAELMAGTIFLVNILMNFHIGYTIVWQYKHYTLLNGRKVARNYMLRGGFWIDAISTLPTIFQIVLLVTPTESRVVVLVLRVMLLVRLVRVTRLLRMMYLLSLTNRLHAVMSDIFSVFGLYVLLLGYVAALTINFFGCTLYLVADLQGLENSWIMRYTTFYGSDSVPDHPVDLLTTTQARKYLTCIYWVTTTMTTVGYGDLTPTTTAETMIIMAVQLVGALLFAVLVGGVSEALGQATSGIRQAQELRLKIARASHWGRSRDLPRSLRSKIYAYYTHPWLERQGEPDEMEVMAELPNSLKAEVALHLMASTMHRLPLFSGLDAWSLQQLTSSLAPRHLGADQELCREGMPSQCLWVLKEGEVRVLRYGRAVESLRGPCVLGDSSILGSDILECRFRPCTVIALTHCQIWELSLTDLQPLLSTSRKAHHQLLCNMRDCLVQALAAAQRPSARPPRASVWTELLLYLSALSTQQDVVQLLASFRGACADDGTLMQAFQQLVHDSCAAVSSAFSPIWHPFQPAYPTHTPAGSTHQSWHIPPSSPVPPQHNLYYSADSIHSFPQMDPSSPRPFHHSHSQSNWPNPASISATTTPDPTRHPPSSPKSLTIPAHIPPDSHILPTDQSPRSLYSARHRSSLPPSPRRHSPRSPRSPRSPHPRSPALTPRDIQLPQDTSPPTPSAPSSPSPSPSSDSSSRCRTTRRLPRISSTTQLSSFTHPAPSVHRMASSEDDLSLASNHSFLSIISSTRNLVMPPDRGGIPIPIGPGRPRRRATTDTTANSPATSRSNSLTNRIASVPNQLHLPPHLYPLPAINTASSGGTPPADGSTTPRSQSNLRPRDCLATISASGPFPSLSSQHLSGSPP